MFGVTCASLLPVCWAPLPRWQYRCCSSTVRSLLTLLRERSLWQISSSWRYGGRLPKFASSRAVSIDRVAIFWRCSMPIRQFLSVVGRTISAVGGGDEVWLWQKNERPSGRDALSPPGFSLSCLAVYEALNLDCTKALTPVICFLVRLSWRAPIYALPAEYACARFPCW